MPGNANDRDGRKDPRGEPSGRSESGSAPAFGGFSRYLAVWALLWILAAGVLIVIGTRQGCAANTVEAGKQRPPPAGTNATGPEP